MDDHEKHGRRSCLKIHQMETSENESESELALKIQSASKKWILLSIIMN